MNEASPRLEPADCAARALPVGFISICAAAFCISVAATIYFCRSMCCEMEMPGGWNMSMMWMRMHGQTWLASATSFLLMWLAMMVVMMLPSTLPMLVKSRRSFAEGKSANSSVSISLIASGYFAMWLAVGAVIYALGIAFAATAMRWESFSRAVPGLAGAALVAAGAIQFTRWKMSSLLRCRTPFGRVVSCQADEADFLLGCKQGAACCICCTAPMVIQLALGVMNPFVMVGVAIIIAAEKLLPRPEIIARIVGLSAIVAGIATISMILMRKS